MKYVKSLFLLFIVLTFGIAEVDALKCSNAVSKDLGQIASYVKASYEVIDNSEIKTLTIDEESTNYIIPNYKFDISIYNVTPEIYLTIENDVYKNTFTVYNADTTDNTYTFSNTDFGTIYHYTIAVRSANQDCYGEKIRTIKLTKPKYNAYSEYTYCKNSSNLYCQKFTTTDLGIKSSEDFLNKIKVNNENNNPNKDEIQEIETIKNLLSKNWKIYLLILVIVIVITIITILYIKKKNQKKGWKL